MNTQSPYVLYIQNHQWLVFAAFLSLFSFFLDPLKIRCRL